MPHRHGGNFSICGIIGGMDMLVCFVSVVAVCIAILMMFLTSPLSIGPFGVLFFFTTIYFAGLALAVFGCRLFFWILGKLDKARAGGEKRKSYFYGMVIAMAPVLFLVCRTLGALTWVELGLVVLFEAILCFLVSKRIL